MLAPPSQRVFGLFTRPAISLRRGLQLQRRFIHPSRSSRSQLQSLPRPNTWLAKLRFRADGEPRSSLTGLNFKNFAFLILCYIVSLPISKRNHEDRILLLRVELKKKVDALRDYLIHIVETDAAYDSVNFDDPISTRSYFTKLNLCVPITISEEEELNLFIEEVMSEVIKTEDGSTQSAEIPVHHIMRSAAEKVHNILGQYDYLSLKSLLEARHAVKVATSDALNSIMDLMYDAVDSPAAEWRVLSD